MPEQVAFDTFMVVVITEFCIMAAVLVVVIGRSFDRAFRYLEIVTALREERDSAYKALAWCLEGFDGTHHEGFYESPLYKRIEALLGEELIRRIQAEAAKEED
jgi:hypothetical protein